MIPDYPKIRIEKKRHGLRASLYEFATKIYVERKDKVFEVDVIEVFETNYPNTVKDFFESKVHITLKYFIPTEKMKPVKSKNPTIGNPKIFKKIENDPTLIHIQCK